jgi:FixJ family two-component response regulator
VIDMTEAADAQRRLDEAKEEVNRLAWTRDAQVRALLDQGVPAVRIATELGITAMMVTHIRHRTESQSS